MTVMAVRRIVPRGQSTAGLWYAGDGKFLIIRQIAERGPGWEIIGCCAEAALALHAGQISGVTFRTRAEALRVLTAHLDFTAG